MIMRVLIDLTTCLGFASASTFLLLFRPSSYRSGPMLNAVGMTLTLWLIMLSTLLLSLWNGSFFERSSHDPEQIVYLILRCTADAILLSRLVSFLRFRDDYRAVRIIRRSERERVTD